MAVTSRLCMWIQFQCVVLLTVISMGSCLQCYKCMSADRHCYNGNPEHLAVLTCSSNETCATFQYEMDNSRVSYVTTIRGCHPNTKDGICSQLMKTKSSKKGVQKGILCNTCSTDLCNSSAVKTLSFSVLYLVMFLNFF